MQRLVIRLEGLAVLAIGLVLVGCGSKDSESFVASTVPVKGRVLYRGQPVQAGSITFEPDGGREAHGSIQPDGTFTLTTFKEGDGAVPGTHRVAVDAGRAIPIKFKSLSSSRIEVEVKSGTTEYTIELK